jgi:hypothetical protein
VEVPIAEEQVVGALDGSAAELAGALDAVAAVAEDGAREQARLAVAARAAARDQRRVPLPATGVRVREVLDRVAAHAERLAGAAGELRRCWAASLAAEGFSRRQIAARLGVSHQRVSALLGRKGAERPVSP